MSNDAPEDFRGLPTTDWSLVAHASLPDEQTGLESLNELLGRYRPALKAHLVLKKKFPPPQADDLIQGFLSAKVLEDGLVSRADPRKGKFRTILLTALDNYVIGVIRHDGAKKRSPEKGSQASMILPISSARFNPLPTHLMWRGPTKSSWKPCDG